MATKCNDNKEIKRDGSSQAGRFLKMLDPANAPLDDRKPEDILVFAKHYADLMRFYDINEDVDWANTAAENKNADTTKEETAKKTVYTWKEFFYKDIAVVVASIAQYKDKLPLIKKEYDDKRKEVDNNPVIENYRDLFKTITHLLQRITRWHSRSIDDHPLKNELELKINSTLAPALKKLMGYDKGSEVVEDDGLEITEEYDFFKTDFLNIDYAAVPKDESIYEGKTDALKIKHAALYVDDIFQEVLKVYKELTERSDYYLKAALENYPEHQPHMALFLSFVQLFTYAQKEMNGLTQRHLEFYYRDVLHLQERAASPDAVYLIYELAKEATEYDLQKSTALTAGKDATGKELIYKTEDELVINKGKVKELKTVFLDKKIVQDNNNNPVEQIDRIYAARVANSADGNGTLFTVAESTWPAMGYFIPEFDSNQNITNKTGEEAEIGFAIASPQLFLAEGVRKIIISLPIISKTNLKSLETFLEIQLTGEKEWIRIMKYRTGKIRGYSITDNQITINIPISEQAITAYDKKIHGEGYDTKYPVIKFIVKDSVVYGILKESVIDNASGVTITVDVKGIKNLILSNDDGPIDTTKAFNPFSLKPAPNSGISVRNKEIFSKELTEIKLFFKKKMQGFEFSQLDLPIDSLWVKPTLYKNNSRTDLASVPHKSLDFFIDPLQINSTNTDPLIRAFPRNFYANGSYNSPSQAEGYLYLSLHAYSLENQNNNSKLIDKDDELNTKIITLGVGDRFEFFSQIAQLLEISELVLDYTSTQNFESGIEQFFHLYPFGTVETFPIDNTPISFEELDKSKDNLLVNTNYLLPQVKYGFNNSNFTGENQYLSAVYQQGNLLIGIQDLKPPQNLSILFKIADGTAEDNDSEPPKINWSYLINNEWRSLPDENIIVDSTYGFQATGIILFDFPADATNNNTLQTKGLHWLCASVDKDADRIPKIIEVIAQANKAVFYDQQNDPLHYKIPLPAESIAKMSVKVPEVKVVQQPFESFDGKMREEGKVFYARASERLRHKHRAITPWDYEHLVLQHFPGIYKVKCLTHTDPECICRPKPGKVPIPADKCCCGQVAPGHVLIVPVLNLRNKNAVDILKPRTGRLTLIQIEKYLKKLTSPFVHVHAKNPKFEEIKTAFNVKFYTGTDKGRYKKQLNEDLIKYLTPWAFDVNREVIFGGSVYASAIINFIEELDYVDYITCFRMIHIVKGCCETDTFTDLVCPVMMKKIDDTIPADVELRKRFLNVIEATSPQAILTSAKKHCIELITDPQKKDDCNCS